MSDCVESCGKREKLSSKNAKNSPYPAFFALDSTPFFRYNRHISQSDMQESPRRSKASKPSSSVFAAQPNMQESPSGMASASQADPGGDVRQPPSAAKRCEGTTVSVETGGEQRYNQICRNRLAVWRQLPKLIPAGSTPVSCSNKTGLKPVFSCFFGGSRGIFENLPPICLQFAPTVFSSKLSPFRHFRSHRAEIFFAIKRKNPSAPLIWLLTGFSVIRLLV